FVWSSSWILRHARRSLSGAAPCRAITTPQHSAGYSAAAWAWIFAYSSGVRIIGRGSAPDEGWPAPGKHRPAPRRGQASPPGEGRPAPFEGWNDRDFVAVLESRLEPLQRLDALVVHVDVDVIVDLARLVAHETLEPAVASLELVEQPAHVARVDRHAVLVVR